MTTETNDIFQSPIDAQQIVLDTDPEQHYDAGNNAAEDDNQCCCQACCCGRIIYWYLSPLTCSFCHTLKCLIFHPLNFAMAIFLLTWDSTMIGTGIGLIPLFCMGIPLLWISMECIIAFSRFDLAMHGMVEQKKKINKDRAHLLTLSLYFGEIPLCCCYNKHVGNCLNTMVERIKYLFTSSQMYCYMLYHVFVRPVIAFSTWWIIIVVAVNIALIGTPFWYIVDDSHFKSNQVILGWNTKCSFQDDLKPRLQCPEDYIWIINTCTRAVGVGLFALFIFPLTLRLNNYFAYLNKIAAYKFYTYYYTQDPELIKSKKPILGNNNYGSSDINNQRINSV